ncbi:MAG: preprotein translocase subunit SecE, partial [Proteobacteria bacterium]|nr:preprotein translocase subunit SecE [Pseudomonadota bacterium]
GRVAVSKTVGWGFDSSRPCQPSAILVAMVSSTGSSEPYLSRLGVFMPSRFTNKIANDFFEQKQINKMNKTAKSALKFFRDVVEEAKKLQFPSKKETYFTTVTIFVTITLVSLAILFADFLISKIIKLIFGL